MPPNPKIVQLRQQLAERFPGLRTGTDSFPDRSQLVWPTGLEKIDGQLHGGFPKGGITELVGDGATSGTTLLLHTLLQRTHETNQFMGLIDGSDSFDATAFEGSVLSRLLWLRCRNTEEALKSTDILLRDRNLPLVILDLKQNAAKELKKIPGTTWYRFQRLIEQTSTVFLIVTPRPMVNSAEMRFHLENHFTLRDVDSDPSELAAQLTATILHERVMTEKRDIQQSA